MKKLMLIVVVIMVVVGCKTNDVAGQEKTEKIKTVSIFKCSEPEIKTDDDQYMPKIIDIGYIINQGMSRSLFITVENADMVYLTNLRNNEGERLGLRTREILSPDRNGVYHFDQTTQFELVVSNQYDTIIKSFKVR